MIKKITFTAKMKDSLKYICGFLMITKKKDEKTKYCCIKEKTLILTTFSIFTLAHAIYQFTEKSIK